MQYLVALTQTRPIAIHFSFYQPPEREAPVYVPKLLGPLGAFVQVEVRREKKGVVYQSQKPKINLKLHPSRAESYHLLEPGYTYGIVLQVEELQLEPGDYQLYLSYSNLPFQGFPGYTLGELSYSTTLSFQVD